MKCSICPTRLQFLVVVLALCAGYAYFFSGRGPAQPNGSLAGSVFGFVLIAPIAAGLYFLVSKKNHLKR